MPKPACPKCSMFYRPKKNAILVIEGAPDANKVWSPYKVWYADLWHCLSCGHELISGFGKQPVSERHENDFQGWVARATHTINDY